ncbi:Cd2+/Zn2+-exporting ATPase [Clostridium cavendishii DSM 21758]|uniref:Cd2+/Zn2+-exporting ATPase n=1 Tax=Clostridium cavendishii DSM 21758 TaxID=1121302 RepID=A0A1M6LMD8_9CLOT|nr:heavy metal translocating P-type ATPase [Clostridium cavendishii]SHJ72359.1 Cd2+/Zn2+-exporting ATPase [Clostridium cavendishii DSM 21758]
MKNIKLYLEGIDCANCAAKIENKINKLESVKEASLNFANGALVVEPVEADNKEEVLIQVKKIINKLEPDVIINNKEISTTKNQISKKVKLKNSSINDEKRINDLKKVQIKNFNTTKEKNEHEHNHSHEHEHSHSHDNSDAHSHSHDHSHSHAHGDGKIDKSKIIRFSIAVILFMVGFISKLDIKIEFVIYLISYILVGGDVVLQAFKNIRKGEIFDENFLMVVATIGAFAIKEFPEAVGVMLFYQVGETFQDLAVNKSRKSIAELMNIRPDYANLKTADGEKVVSPEEVKIGDLIIVKTGEKVPLDGIVEEGKGFLDTSALTGESIPREIEVDDEVLAGSINKNGLLQIRVTKNFAESTVAKILDLVENAGNKKAPTEKFITKFARYYTPIVVIAALLLAIVPPIFMEGFTFHESVYRALVFLVVSCPCALVISIPLAFFGGIGAASKNGILIKGGNYLEALKNAEAVVFDKTGTLTKGIFKVTKINAEADLNEDELLELAAYTESYSNHPIAISIVKEFKGEIKKDLIEDYSEISGKGIKVKVSGRQVLAGNKKLMKDYGVDIPDTDEIGTVVHFILDNSYVGNIVIADEIKEDAKKAISILKNIGIKNTVMLTGDSIKVGEAVGKSLGLDKVYGELLPQNKVEKLEEIFNNKTEKGKIIFVGDGINDAPVLARADVGIAMGGLGSDAAIEAADVVIMNDEPSKISTAIDIAKKTNIIVWQNIIFALGVKIVILVLASFGIATMWEGVFGDVGVALIAIINSMRVLRK